jgi:hypothetical protein
LAQAEPKKAIKPLHEVKVEFTDGNSTLGSFVIPVEINTELPTFNISTTKEKTINQVLETIKHMEVNESNWPILIQDYKHAVGGDGCPMPLFDFSVHMANNVSPEMKNKFTYGITGLSNVDAIFTTNPSGLAPKIIDINGTNFQFFPPDANGVFQLNFIFNCSCLKCQCTKCRIACVLFRWYGKP